jgi:hypothetical protein
VKLKIEADVQKEKKSRQDQMTIELEWLRVHDIDCNVDDYGISIVKVR